MSFKRNKLWYVHPTEYYLAVKRNELPSHTKTWVNLKCIFLSGRSQPEKATYHMMLWKGKTIEMENRSVVARGLG